MEEAVGEEGEGEVVLGIMGLCVHVCARGSVRASECDQG